jgi:DNA polymerase III subunit delta'
VSDELPSPSSARPPFPQGLPWLAATEHALLGAGARFPQALLIEGPEGIGKGVLAMRVARARLCEAPAADGSACGACASCDYVAAGQHPDLRVVEPVVYDEEGNATPQDVIRIDAIRDLTEWSQVTSHRRGAKIAVIAPAEAMHYAAANALLKTLEEPPAGTSLLLVSHQPGRLPATIRSRCLRQVVPLPPPDLARAWLAENGVAEPESVLAQAGGAPFLARHLADPGRQAERGEWLRMLAVPERFDPVGLAARIDLVPKDERRSRLGDALDGLIGWTADLARVAAGGSPARNPDFAPALTRLGPRVARLSLLRYHRALLRQRALLQHPLQPRLVAEALLIDYRTLFSHD